MWVCSTLHKAAIAALKQDVKPHCVLRLKGQKAGFFFSKVFAKAATTGDNGRTVWR